MLVWLFRDTRILHIYQALKILVVNIYNCYKETMSSLMDLFLWYNPTAIPLARPLNLSRLLKTTKQVLHRMILSPLLLFWNCLIHYHALWYSSNPPLRSLHQIPQRLWNLAVYKTMIVLSVNSSENKHKPQWTVSMEARIGRLKIRHLTTKIANAFSIVRLALESR